MLSVCHVATLSLSFFFFNDTATTEIYTLSLHDALPISVPGPRVESEPHRAHGARPRRRGRAAARHPLHLGHDGRSEEHTSELQSRLHLVCRLLLEKKKKNKPRQATRNKERVETE